MFGAEVVVVMVVVVGAGVVVVVVVEVVVVGTGVVVVVVVVVGTGVVVVVVDVVEVVELVGSGVPGTKGNAGSSMAIGTPDTTFGPDGTGTLFTGCWLCGLRSVAVPLA